MRYITVNNATFTLILYICSAAVVKGNHWTFDPWDTFAVHRKHYAQRRLSSKNTTYSFCGTSWEEILSIYDNNNTNKKPQPIRFCADGCDYNAVIMMDAVGSSYKLHNMWQIDNGLDRCALDFTDYSIYTSIGFVPAVNPCSTGGFLPYLLLLLYCFLGLMVVCDEYFVPALEVMVEVLGLDDDVAGATLMAAGGSAPELFTSIMGTFLSESNVGFGTIVGSAVFNVLFVIGCCAIFAKEILQLTWWPLARDCSCYLVGLVYLYLCFAVSSPFEIEWWEALSLFALYIGYVIIMKFNKKLHLLFSGWLFGDNTSPAVAPTVDDNLETINHRYSNNLASYT